MEKHENKDLLTCFCRIFYGFSLGVVFLVEVKILPRSVTRSDVISRDIDVKIKYGEGRSGAKVTRHNSADSVPTSNMAPITRGLPNGAKVGRYIFIRFLNLPMEDAILDWFSVLL